MAALAANDGLENGQARGGGLQTFRDTTGPIKSPRHVFEATTSIGLRPTQEDRFLMIPKFFRDDCSFCGVFDGTVGDDAAEFVNQNIVNHLCTHLNLENGSCDELFSTTAPPSDGQKDGQGNRSVLRADVSDEVAETLRDGIRNTFLSTDGSLIEMCTEKNLHYSSSTGVTTFLWRNLLTVAHIGDSKACIARMVDSDVRPEWLTVDHKPNMPSELRRIEASGGSLAWLHGNKPYIRGGDFFKRQALGEHPKQLNYSRAFGGKDLKMFGLSAEPDISHFEITADDRLVLIGSDGLWDVLNPRVACNIALKAFREGRSATQDIVAATIREMPICGVRDNITVIAIFLNVE